MESELLRGNTPTLVLAALAEGPQHGYAIAQEINKRTDNSLKFKQGTLYPVLHTLEREGLVTGQWQHVAGERPRLVYVITEAGRAELARRVDIWQTFAKAMDTMIGSASKGATPSEQPQ
ncbi:MAG: PadR family transcriptional regulator [Janthinobacterium lividum]